MPQCVVGKVVFQWMSQQGETQQRIQVWVNLDPPSKTGEKKKKLNAANIKTNS